MEIERNARLARACERCGVLLMIEPRSAREATNPDDRTDSRLLALYCRIAAEIGADIVKCIYAGTTEKMAEVVAGCPAPVLVAGGARAAEAQTAFQQAESAIAARAAGLVFGRNIYQSADPAAAVACYRTIVHGEAA
jgi:class I fructose-bisphosphate aldolase